MFNFLPGPFKYVIGCSVLAVTTTFCSLYVTLMKLMSLLAPTEKIKYKLTQRVATGMSLWQKGNRFIMNLICRPKFDIRGLEGLSEDKWYLLVSNHMSGFDIAVLSYVFQDKIPPAKYFLKKELLYVPFLGVGCWALGMAFVKRYSHKHMRKNKHMKNESLIQTKKACQHFKQFPTTVVNFLEGGRFTKKKCEHSPYQHLLRPKAGGIALTLGALENQFDKLLNVTLVYPSHHQQENILFSFLMGRLGTIVVQVETLDIPQIDYALYSSDAQCRAHFQQWLNHLWAEKDKQIQKIIDTYEKNSRVSTTKLSMPIGTSQDDLRKSGM